MGEIKGQWERGIERVENGEVMNCVLRYLAGFP